jgi:putative acetyltransferase
VSASIEISQATLSDLPQLFDVWMASTRSMHRHLGERDVRLLIPFVKQALLQCLPVPCVRDGEERIVAFLTIYGDAIEMVHVHPAHRGRRLGRRLVDHAVGPMRVQRVEVGEQNTGAVAFFQRLGFREVDRSPRDVRGSPFALLQLTPPSPMPPLARELAVA